MESSSKFLVGKAQCQAPGLVPLQSAALTLLTPVSEAKISLKYWGLFTLEDPRQSHVCYLSRPFARSPGSLLGSHCCFHLSGSGDNQGDCSPLPLLSLSQIKSSKVSLNMIRAAKRVSQLSEPRRAFQQQILFLPRPPLPAQGKLMRSLRTKGCPIRQRWRQLSLHCASTTGFAPRRGNILPPGWKNRGSCLTPCEAIELLSTPCEAIQDLAKEGPSLALHLGRGPACLCPFCP